MHDYDQLQVYNMGRAKRIWYLSPMRAAKVQASLRIRAVSPEPLLLAHTSSESRGTYRQKARSLAPLNGWACAVKICHDGMLEDTNSLGGAHMVITRIFMYYNILFKLSLIPHCCKWQRAEVRVTVHYKSILSNKHCCLLRMKNFKNSLSKCVCVCVCVCVRVSVCVLQEEIQ